jgi:ADP-dependent NAD(P)H-hydrate dehydratase / NAD(P)H-hydrate epimerase
MKCVSVQEIVAIEKEADQKGFTYSMMMENAGKGLADLILDKFSGIDNRTILGLVGSGNNGGDTLVALDYLNQNGWRTSVLIIRPREPDDPLIERFETSGGKLIRLNGKFSKENLKELLEENHIILDGILGTGIRLPLKEELAKLMGFISSQIELMEEPPIIVAVDCPSGVDCDSGESAKECLHADLTVTMAAIKQGLLKFPAYELAGEIQVVSIGLPSDEEDLQAWKDVKTFIPDQSWVKNVLPDRPLDSHKGTFGTALIVAGSINYTGAAYLAGRAAYLSGTGLVTLAVPNPIHAILAGQIPEATWLILPHEIGVIAESAADVVHHNLERTTALLVGPGFGMEETTGEFIKRLLVNSISKNIRSMGFLSKTEKMDQDDETHLPPLVIDADGLKLLKRIPDWAKVIPGEAVLTPHPGEMSFLTGLPVKEIQAERIGAARKWSKEWGHVVVLKGAFTVICSPEGECAIVPVASPALARAGSGDVLAGIIVGLRAQGVSAFHAAVAGAWIHAQAGVTAAIDIGNTCSVLAGDILERIPDVISEIA